MHKTSVFAVCKIFYTLQIYWFSLTANHNVEVKCQITALFLHENCCVLIVCLEANVKENSLGHKKWVLQALIIMHFVTFDKNDKEQCRGCAHIGRHCLSPVSHASRSILTMWKGLCPITLPHV